MLEWRVDGALFGYLCYLMLRLEILHVCKCFSRSLDQSHGVFELISKFYELSKAIDIEP